MFFLHLPQTLLAYCSLCMRLILLKNFMMRIILALKNALHSHSQGISTGKYETGIPTPLPMQFSNTETVYCPRSMFVTRLAELIV